MSLGAEASPPFWIHRSRGGGHPCPCGSTTAGGTATPVPVGPPQPGGRPPLSVWAVTPFCPLGVLRRLSALGGLPCCLWLFLLAQSGLAAFIWKFLCLPDCCADILAVLSAAVWKVHEKEIHCFCLKAHCTLSPEQRLFSSPGTSAAASC